MSVHVMQFVAELDEYKPRIWRRFQIRSDMDLEGFCYTLMEMFRMLGCHLFEFTIKGQRYTLPLPDVDVWGEPAKNVRGVAVNKLFKREGDCGELWYDFGDSWYVKVKLEVPKVTEIVSIDELPRVIKGKGFGIVEDCGGVWGLANIAEGLKTGNVEDWDDTKNWLEDICPEIIDKGVDYFDIDEINMHIKKRPHITFP